MQNPSSFSQSYKEEDSYLDISESCVRSDIADLISKMYTPSQQIPCTSVNTSTNMNAVDRDMICRKAESSSNRFGFHFYAVETRNDFKVKVESSESDSVSLPKIKKKLKRSRYVCECCKRQSWKYVPKERRRCGCGNLKTAENHKCFKLEETAKPLQLEQCSLVCRGRGDVNQKESNKTNRNPICKVNGNSKSAPAIIPCTQLYVHKHTACNNGTFYDEKECLQVVPDITVHIGTDFDHENLMANPVLKDDYKIPQKSIFKRFIRGISSWPEAFHRNTSLNSNKAHNNLSNLENVVSKDDRNHDTEDLLSCHCKIPQLTNDAQKRFKRKRGCQNLLQNPEKIKSILCKTRNGQSNHILDEEVHMESNVPHIEQKLPKSTSTCQEKGNEYNSVVIKCSSLESITSKINYFPQEERKNDDTNPNDPMYEEGKMENLKQMTVEDEVCRPMCQPNRMPPTPGGADCVNCRYKKHRHTPERCPLLHTDLMVERADDWATRFWARVFRPCHILLIFFTAFVLQFLRFVLHSLVEPLLWGTVQIGSDFFFQPCLRILYSSIIQPILLLLQNTVSSICNLCLPIAQCFGAFLKEFAHICKACRLVEINKIRNVYGESRDH